jgi:hypothetical protein
MWQIAVKFLSFRLKCDQKRNRSARSGQKEGKYIYTFITEYESWGCGHDPETKQQTSRWKCPLIPPPRKSVQLRPNSTRMLNTLFFKKKNGWIIHYEFLPWGESVNQPLCMGDQMCLTELMRGKRQDIWRTHEWRLNRDIAPAHTALSAQPSLTERNMAVGSTLLLRPNPLWRLRVSKDNNPMQGTKIQGYSRELSWNTGGTGETILPRHVCSSGATVAFVKISAVKATLCTGASKKYVPLVFTIYSPICMKLGTVDLNDEVSNDCTLPWYMHSKGIRNVEHHCSYPPHLLSE